MAVARAFGRNGARVFLAGRTLAMEQGTVLGRLPTLSEVADVAVFAASDRAAAMTGAILDVTCGSIPD
jgi:NAD(P)-dependent dehydrogenase (short-subunit alcohol dehydrogenase family)